VARKRTWSLVDDFDGTPAAETVTFALDGTTYEVDLSEDNATELRDTLAPWIQVGRKVRAPRRTTNGRKRSSAGGRARREGYDRAAVRDWASTDAGKKALRAAKVDPPAARGRISTAVVELYKAST
jgi:hypothetical protein